MGAPEIYFDHRGEFGLEAWEKLLARFPEHAPRAIASALKSEGYRIQQLIKLAVQRGGEPKWPALNPHGPIIRLAKRSRNAKMSKLARGVKARRTKWEKAVAQDKHIESGGAPLPLQKLAGASCYRYDDSTKTVTIGFLDQRKRGLGKMHAAGYKIEISDRMRKLLFASGMPLKKETTELTVPARPVVGFVFEREKKNIVNNIKVRVVNNIYRYLTNREKDWDASMRDEKGNY